MFAMACPTVEIPHQNGPPAPYDAAGMTGPTIATPDAAAAAAAASAARRTPHPFAWQGWRLSVPASWNAVKLEGDFAKGHALLADLDGPRLGLRWQTVEAKRATRQALERVAREEVGTKATRTVGDAVVYLDPEPPGRDIAVRWSLDSGRLIQIAYHARRRDDVLVGELLPSLADASAKDARPWAVFDLACAVPRELHLASHRLNAGDLELEFAGGRRFVNVRQVALAEIALRRLPIAGWLAEPRRYRATEEPSPITIHARDGRSMQGFITSMRRRRRFFWSAATPAARVALALHDLTRDRLLLVEAGDESLARDVAATVGCDV